MERMWCDLLLCGQGLKWWGSQEGRRRRKRRRKFDCLSLATFKIVMCALRWCVLAEDVWTKWGRGGRRQQRSNLWWRAPLPMLLYWKALPSWRQRWRVQFLHATPASSSRFVEIVSFGVVPTQIPQHIFHINLYIHKLHSLPLLLQLILHFFYFPFFLRTIKLCIDILGLLAMYIENISFCLFYQHSSSYRDWDSFPFRALRITICADTVVSNEDERDESAQAYPPTL